MTASHTSRKEDHLRVCLEENVAFRYPTSGFEDIQLPHRALPELALDEIDLAAEFLGHKLRAPLLISSMTGGAPSAGTINRNLALAAQEIGVALALGSLRAALENPDTLATYQVRDLAPDVFLCANLGAVQLNYGYGLEECQRAVDLVQANALVLHLNPLQEALQPDGDTDFAGLLEKIAAICSHLSVPVIVKEVGWGISGIVARQLAEAGVAAIDVAGAGGTSWSQVEMYRNSGDPSRRGAEAFENWGIPTAQAIIECRRTVPEMALIASGGLRNGVHMAKALALGARIAGMALPLLRPATESPNAAIAYLRESIHQLRIAMFCTGCRQIEELRELQLTVRYPGLRPGA